MALSRFAVAAAAAALNLALFAFNLADAVPGLSGLSMSWADSYSIGGKCRCLPASQSILADFTSLRVFLAKPLTRQKWYPPFSLFSPDRLLRYNLRPRR